MFSGADSSIRTDVGNESAFNVARLLNRGYNHYETLWISEGQGEGNADAEPDAGAGETSKEHVGLIVQRFWAECMVDDNKTVEIRNTTSHKKKGLRAHFLSGGKRSVVDEEVCAMDTIMGVGVFQGVINYGQAIARTPEPDAVQWQTSAQKHAFEVDQQAHMVDAKSFAVLLHTWSLQKDKTYRMQTIWGWRFSDIEKVGNKYVPHKNGWYTWAYFGDSDVYKEAPTDAGPPTATETTPGHEGRSLDEGVGGTRGNRSADDHIMLQMGGRYRVPRHTEKRLAHSVQVPCQQKQPLRTGRRAAGT